MRLRVSLCYGRDIFVIAHGVFCAYNKSIGINLLAAKNSGSHYGAGTAHSLRDAEPTLLHDPAAVGSFDLTVKRPCSLYF